VANDDENVLQFTLELEAVIEVTDLEALKSAARDRVDECSYMSGSIDPDTGLSEEQADRLRLESDPGEAFMIAFSCDTGVDGTEMVETTMSVSSATSVSSTTPTTPAPAFESLYEACSCAREACDKCSVFQLTPRTAAVVWRCLKVLSDDAYEDVLAHGDDRVDEDDDWLLFHRFPRLTFGQDAVWRRQAARAFDDLADDLGSGECPGELFARCTGEEMAFHLAIEDAEAGLAGEPQIFDDLVRSLPSHRDDFDWEMCSEDLFQDHDVLLLFDASLDGVESPDSDVNRRAGMGDMRAAQWFVPFLNVEPRDGRRPFRH
jgi:hypothetical protein